MFGRQTRMQARRNWCEYRRLTSDELRTPQETAAHQRVVPLVAARVELIPRLRRWHNGLGPRTSRRLGRSIASFVDHRTRTLGVAATGLPDWRPEAARGRRARRG